MPDNERSHPQQVEMGVAYQVDEVDKLCYNWGQDSRRRVNL